MAMEITPRGITLYPGDVQQFAILGAPPPNGWRDIQNATAQADGSLEGTVSNAADGNTFSGQLLHSLRSGLGEITFTLDDQSEPTNAGYFYIEVFNEGGTVSLSIQINTTDIDVGVVGMTLSGSGNFAHTSTDGDVFTIKIDGNRWSVWVNGVEKRYATPSTSVAYPIHGLFFIQTRVQTSPPRIPPVTLTGDWQVQLVEWSATGGTLSLPNGNLYTGDERSVVIYKAQGLAGVYEVAARPYLSSEPPGVSVPITIPPLMIVGPHLPAVFEVDPGEVIDLTTNYARTQEVGLISWTAVTAGGTFSSIVSGRYTASTTPGDYIVRASATSWDTKTQKDEITIRVRSVLTPASEPVAPSEPRTNSSNVTAPQNWSASGVTITGSGPISWTAPADIGKKVYISVEKDNGDLITNTYEVLASFPAEFNLPADEAEVGADMLIEYPQGSRTPHARQTSPVGFRPESLPLQIFNVDQSEREEIEEFLDQYWTSQGRFFIEDRAYARRMVVRIDSKWTVRRNQVGYFDIAFRVRKA